jgi:hypothetical protein
MKVEGHGKREWAGHIGWRDVNRSSHMLCLSGAGSSSAVLDLRLRQPATLPFEPGPACRRASAPVILSGCDPQRL